MERRTLYTVALTLVVSTLLKLAWESEPSAIIGGKIKSYLASSCVERYDFGFCRTVFDQSMLYCPNHLPFYECHNLNPELHPWSTELFKRFSGGLSMARAISLRIMTKYQDGLLWMTQEESGSNWLPELPELDWKNTIFLCLVLVLVAVGFIYTWKTFGVTTRITERYQLYMENTWGNYSYDGVQELMKHPNTVLTTDSPKCQVAVVRMDDRGDYRLMGQAIFLKPGKLGKRDVFNTAKHVLDSYDPEDRRCFVTKDFKQYFRIDLKSIKKIDRALNDVVSFEVARGAATKMKLSKANITDTCRDRSSVKITAMGFQEKHILSAGTMRSYSGNAGIYFFGHNAPTVGGFSGAPIFVGNKVVGIHCNTVPGELNSGVFLFMLAGRKLVQIVSDQEKVNLRKECPKKITVEGELTLKGEESPTGGDEEEDDLFEYPEEDNYEFDDYYYDDNEYDYANTKARSSRNKRTGRRRKVYFSKNYDHDNKFDTAPIVGAAGSMRSTPSWVNKAVNSDLFDGPFFGSGGATGSTVNKSTGFYEKTDGANRPEENLNPDDVARAMYHYGRAIEEVNVVAATITALNRGLNLKNALRDREGSMAIARDITELNEFIKKAHPQLAQLAIIFSAVTVKSEEDRAFSKTLSNYRRAHPDKLPETSPEVKDLLFGATTVLTKSLEELSNIKIRAIEDPMMEIEGIGDVLSRHGLDYDVLQNFSEKDIQKASDASSLNSQGEEETSPTNQAEKEKKNLPRSPRSYKRFLKPASGKGKKGNSSSNHQKQQTQKPSLKVSQPIKQSVIPPEKLSEDPLKNISTQQLRACMNYMVENDLADKLMIETVEKKLESKENASKKH